MSGFGTVDWMASDGVETKVWGWIEEDSWEESEEEKQVEERRALARLLRSIQLEMNQHVRKWKKEERDLASEISNFQKANQRNCRFN